MSKITKIINAYQRKKTFKTVSDYIKMMNLLDNDSNEYLNALIYAEKHYPKMLPMIETSTYKLALKFYGGK